MQNTIDKITKYGIFLNVFLQLDQTNPGVFFEVLSHWPLDCITNLHRMESCKDWAYSPCMPCFTPSLDRGPWIQRVFLPLESTVYFQKFQQLWLGHMPKPLPRAHFSLNWEDIDSSVRWFSRVYPVMFPYAQSLRAGSQYIIAQWDQLTTYFLVKDSQAGQCSPLLPP